MKTHSSDLQQIPGVGDSVEQHLHQIGIGSTSELKDKSPEELYLKMCDFKAAPVDRCMLYVLRSSIYYASNADHDPELLKWWNWKDD